MHRTAAVSCQIESTHFVLLHEPPHLQGGYNFNLIERIHFYKNTLRSAKDKPSIKRYGFRPGDVMKCRAFNKT